MIHTYSIAGMTCGGCVAKVKSELLKVPDVTAAEVQLAAPQATITMQRHIAVPALQEALNKAGSFSITADEDTMTAPEAAAGSDSYFPIFLIFGYIAGVSLLVQWAQGSFHLMQWMNHFMGGFFLVFSFFKMMNLAGFAEGYRSYDIVAKALPAYGFVYPFIELALGLAFIAGFQPWLTNAVTLLVMAVSMIGVIRSLARKTPFRCACLGTLIKLPLSKVTLFEDGLMVAMSAVMLFLLTR